MKDIRETTDAQGVAAQVGAQRSAAPALGAEGEGGSLSFGALVNELTELVRSGALPEGFDLEAACSDATFLQLAAELPLVAAIRV